MKKSYLAFTLLFLVFSLAGCESFMQSSAKADNYADAVALPPYSGPKARIAVADFEVKAAKAKREIGTGLREMLVTALVNSNRFSVVERQALKSLMQEQELSTSGAADTETGVQRGKIKTADIIISAAVTEFEPQASGGNAGVGGGGGVGSGVLGGLLGGALNKSHMALDIRIIDASTSEILSSTRVEGQASDVAGAIMAGLFKDAGKGLGIELSAYNNTPMEKAIRICIIEGVRYIVQVIPANYYKH